MVEAAVDVLARVMLQDSVRPLIRAQDVHSIALQPKRLHLRRMHFIETLHIEAWGLAVHARTSLSGGGQRYAGWLTRYGSWVHRSSRAAMREQFVKAAGWPLRSSSQAALCSWGLLVSNRAMKPSRSHRGKRGASSSSLPISA